MNWCKNLCDFDFTCFYFEFSGGETCNTFTKQSAGILTGDGEVGSVCYAKTRNAYI